MSDKLSPSQIETIGDDLARRGESGSTTAVIKELDQLKRQNPGEYTAVVRSMEQSNLQHVQKDRQEVEGYNSHKWPWQRSAQAHVPNLIIEDRSKDKSHPDYRLAGTMLTDKPGEPAAAAGTRAGKGLDSDRIPLFAAYNEGVALREADKVQGLGDFAPKK